MKNTNETKTTNYETLLKLTARQANAQVRHALFLGDQERANRVYDVYVYGGARWETESWGYDSPQFTSRFHRLNRLGVCVKGVNVVLWREAGVTASTFSRTVTTEMNMTNTKLTAGQTKTLEIISRGWTADVDRRSADALVRKGLAETTTWVTHGDVSRGRRSYYHTAYRAVAAGE